MPVPVETAKSPRRLMRDEVFSRLLDAIVSGDLEPSEQLHDAEIEKWVGASRTPVREALNQLAGMGLVDILPQRRTRVSRVDPVRTRELVDLLGSLGRTIAADTTALLTSSDLAELTNLEAAARARETTEPMLRDRLAQLTPLRVIARRLDNAAVSRLVQRHGPEVRRAINVARTPIDREAVARELAALGDALASKNPARASEAMEHYVDSVVLPLTVASSAAGHPNEKA